MDGSTALHWAAQRDNVEIVDLLLAAGANPKTATRYNVTPLAPCLHERERRHHRTPVEGRRRCERHLGRRRNCTDDGRAHRKADAVKVLLAHGADVHAKDPSKGQTALMWAASEGNAAAVELLVECRSRH